MMLVWSIMAFMTSLFLAALLVVWNSHGSKWSILIQSNPLSAHWAVCYHDTNTLVCACVKSLLMIGRLSLFVNVAATMELSVTCFVNSDFLFVFLCLLGRRNKDWVQSLESVPFKAGSSHLGRSWPDPHQARLKGHVPGSCLWHHGVPRFWHCWTGEYYTLSTTVYS